MADTATLDLPADVVQPTGFLRTLLMMSQTAVAVLRPLYAADGTTIRDFAWVSLNPAGRRLLTLPACPAESLLTLFPQALAAEGDFPLFCQAFASGELRENRTNYQTDGVDGYFLTVAQRYENVLVVTFTDTNDQPRSAVEQALRQSQAAERAARAEAEQQRQRLTQLVEQAPASIALLHGPAHVFKVANAGYQQLFGHRPLLGKQYREALPELAGQPFFGLIDQVYRTGQSYQGLEEVAYLDRTNSGNLEELYFNYILQATRNAAGQVEGILIFTYEVTEQVRTRQQVEQLNAELEARVQARTAELAQAQVETEAQRHRLHRLVAEAPALIAVLRGPEHVVELANDGFRAIFGGRDLVGKTYRAAIPEFEGQPFFDLLDTVYRTGEAYYGIDEPVTLDRTNSGQLENTFITFTYQATRDAQGKVDGILVFCYEVAAQVLARQERETQRQLLTTVFAQAPVAIGLFTGDELRLTVVNPLLASLLGHPVEHLLGRPLLEGVPELVGQGFDDLLRQVQATRVPFIGREMPATVRRNGELRVTYYNFVYQPLYDADGQLLGIIDVAAEVTEQVLARQQVQDLNQELAAINEELQASNEDLGDSNRQLTRTNVDLDTFVYTASHDLKAPITNIEGILAALRDTLPAEVQQEAVVAHLLGLLDNTVVRFLTTIDQLTDLARLQRSYNEPAERLALVPVIAGVLADLAPVIDIAAAHVQVDVPAELHVSFASSSLRSIVYNLLSNAVKYRDPARPAQVWLQAELQPEGVVLRVRDNGLGLTESQQGRLFGVFQRLHTHVPGTGVGLYMIKRLIENAGARITVSSIPGVGSTFTVTFPD